MPNLSEPGRSEKQRAIHRLTIDKGFGKSCNSLSLADLALMLSGRPYPARFGDGAPVGLARQAGASLFRGCYCGACCEVFSGGACPPEPCAMLALGKETTFSTCVSFNSGARQGRRSSEIVSHRLMLRARMIRQKFM